MIGALTLDQLEIFLAVTETGSFSGAARKARRTASAVTYVVKKMEEQLGVELFNRASYRASLTEAGRTMLPRARRVIEEMRSLQITAQGIASGLEPDLTIAIDSMFPMNALTGILAEFQKAFPTVQLRMFVETFGPARRMVESGEAAFALTSDFSLDDPAFIVSTIRQIVPIMVAPAVHPLAHHRETITPDTLASHVQLVVTDRLQDLSSQDWSVYSAATMRVGDVHTKLQLLRAGLGFGSMPHHLVERDLEMGTLVRLDVNSSETLLPFPIALIRKRERPLGPAARWLVGQVEKLHHVDAERGT